MRLFGYARTSVQDCRQPCKRCYVMNEVDAETVDSLCRQCKFPLHWRFSVFLQRERIAKYCDEAFPNVPRAGVLCEIAAGRTPLGERPHLIDLIGHLREKDVLVIASRFSAWPTWHDGGEAISRVLDQGAAIAFAAEGAIVSPDDENSLAMLDMMTLCEAERREGYGQNIRLDIPFSHTQFKRKAKCPPGYSYVCRWCFLNGEPFLPRWKGVRCVTCGNHAHSSRMPYPDKEAVSLMLAVQNLHRQGWSDHHIMAYLRGVLDSEGEAYTRHRVRQARRAAESLSEEDMQYLVSLTGAEPLFTGDGNELAELAARVHAPSARFIERHGAQNAIRGEPLASCRWTGHDWLHKQGFDRGVPLSDAADAPAPNR